ncbi:TorD/DmsD family molecular chaperone [Halorubrum sp. DTA98]|uniref:TorD/DmsD family molecular chaperone n=1 Tax=Halorubrum sp. DTA98 TaxID=3402163 RepID=UPI003AAE3374
MTAVESEPVAADGLGEDDVASDARGDAEDAGPEATGGGVTLESLAALHALLARCFEQPDVETSEAIRSGAIVERIGERAGVLDIDVDRPPLPDRPHEAYLRTFDAFEGGEYAPPAESVYEPWWDGTDRGILSGPPAHDMERRYEAVGVETPDAYPSDHVALELEYASLLLEHGADGAYVAFAEEHFDWVPALRERVERTSDVAFHRWAARTLDTVVERTVAVLEGRADGGEGTDEQ